MGIGTGFECIPVDLGSESQMETGQMVPAAHTGRRTQSLGEGVKSYSQTERSRPWIFLVPLSRRITFFPDLIGNPFRHDGVSTLAWMGAGCCHLIPLQK